jgi:hypothetical protein
MQEQSQEQEQEHVVSQVQEQSHQQMPSPARTVKSPAAAPVKVLALEKRILPATSWRAYSGGSPA